MRRVNGDLVVALGFAALALVFIIEGRALPVVARGIPGPGLFPLLVAAVILLLSVVLAVQASVGRRGSRAAEVQPGDAGLSPTALADGTGIAPHDGARGDGAAAAGSPSTTATATEAVPAEEEEPRSLTRPLLLWGLVLLVALALPLLGFVPAMLLLTLVLVLFVERRHDVRALATAVAVPVAAYVVFAVLLDVRLPLGPFE